MRLAFSAILLALSICVLAIAAMTRPLLAQAVCTTYEDYVEAGKAYPEITIEKRDARYLNRFLRVTGSSLPAGSMAVEVIIFTGPAAVVLVLIEPDGCASKSVAIPRANFEMLRYQLERDA